MSLRSIDFTGNIFKLGESSGTKFNRCNKELESETLSDAVVEQSPPNEIDGTYQENTKEDIDYFYVGNIPPEYRSADLRLFFKDRIEENAFDCFHYRHRPERLEIKQKIKNSENSSQTEDSNKATSKAKPKCCCIIKCKKDFSQNFYKLYHKRQWFNANRSFSKDICVIRLLKTGSNLQRKSLAMKTDSTIDQIEDENLDLEDFESLIEFDPPENVMPQGNVGTPTKFFHGLIAKCLLPSSMIKKLGIEFPNKRSSRFSSVQLDYNILKNNGVKGTGTGNQKSYASEDTQRGNFDSETINTENREDNDAEEWDRYEALHDDVDNQGRLKERLFEEDIEVKWEKGGSGLVFYTDAYHWNEMKGKDFDEDTVDDWDVDYSIYYEDNAGDKPSRDQLNMRIGNRRKEGKEDGPTKYSEIRRKEKQNRQKMTENFAEFEKYSKAFGSRILRQQGWNKGEGVGSSKHGMKEPLDLKGQLPRKKTGLGYYGEKLDRTIPLKKQRIAENDVYISTKYDEKDGEHLDAMRFHGMELLKYRTPKVDFEKSSSKS